MATITIQLTHGVTLSDKLHKTVTLKELTPGDLIDAGLASERIAQTQDGPVFAVSPTLMGLYTLARQIDAIGDVEMVFGVDDLKLFHREDFELLQLHAEQMDQAVMEAVIQRGRSNEAADQSGTSDG